MQLSSKCNGRQLQNMQTVVAKGSSGQLRECRTQVPAEGEKNVRVQSIWREASKRETGYHLCYLPALLIELMKLALSEVHGCKELSCHQAFIAVKGKDNVGQVFLPDT